MIEVACLMMQKDEDDLLEPWLLYYGNLFGFRNLFVFDNGSTSPKVKEILKRFAAAGVHIDYSKKRPVDFDMHEADFARQIRQLERGGRFDLFLPVDCDEFLVLDGGGGPDCDADAIRDQLARYVDTPGVLRIARSFANCIRRPSSYWRHDFRKVLFSRAGGCAWLGAGFHDGRARRSGPEMTTPLAQVHFHYKPYAMVVAHARNKLAPYVDTGDRKRLSRYSGPCQHVVQHLLRSPAEYYGTLEDETGLIAFPQLAERFVALGAEPFWQRWATEAALDLSGTRAPPLPNFAAPPHRFADRLAADMRAAWLTGRRHINRVRRRLRVSSW